jgi:hypothetical protein
MKQTQKHLSSSADKEYYEKVISKLTDKQKEEFESLVIRLEHAGAKNPLGWASSEVTEGIPQFGRFLLLKNLFEIGKSTEDNISIAGDFDDELDAKYTEIKNIVGEEKLLPFLSSYTKGVLYNVVELLDEGNRQSDQDKISWTLMKTDENFKPTGQIIQGLHEDFIEFEQEIK